MAKKYTAREVNHILKYVLGNALQYMDNYLVQINKMDSKDNEIKTPQTQEQIQRLNMLIILLNDIIHPAHGICYSYFKKYSPMLDVFVKGQKEAFEKKYVPECFCFSCDPDGSKSKARVKEFEEYSVKKELNEKDVE